MAYDGTLKFDTKVDTKGFNAGTKNVTSQMGTLTKSIKGVGLAIAGSFVVKGIKSTIKSAEELQNAMTGLKSIMDGQGRSFKTAQNFITEYTQDGLIPASNAITAYKNLALRGYNTDQIEKVMTALKDSATYGRQSQYTLGEAVQTASEGLKNENSILVDNAGVTKNVAKMWDDYAKSIGKSRTSLTQQEKIQAEVNGILQETKFQTGDAATYMNSYSGQVARLSQQWLTFKQTIGGAFMTLAQAILPVLNKIMSALIQVAQVFASVISAIFGKFVKTNKNVAKTAKKASSGISNMGDAAESAGKQAEDALLPFDDLNVLQQQTGSGGTGGAGGGVDSGVDMSDLGELDIDTSQLEQLPSYIQAIFDKIRKIIGRMKDAFKPTIDAWTGAFSQLWKNLQPIFAEIGTNAQRYITDYFLPLVDFLIFDFIAPIVNAFSEQFAPIFTGFILQAVQLFSTTFGNYITMMVELLNNTFIPCLTQLRDTFLLILPTIMEALQNWYNLIIEIADYFLNSFILPIYQAMVETLLPIFTDIFSAAMQIFADTFKWAVDMINSVWETVLKPIFELIKKVVLDVLQTVKKLWDEYGETLLNNIKEFMKGVQETIQLLWDNIMVPIIQPFLEMLSWLWEKHLKGLVEQVGEFVMKLANGALEIYNKFIKPIIDFLILYLGPTFSEVFSFIGNVIGSIIGVIADVASGIFKALGGIIDFIVGIFTGDWEKAWNGIKNFFGGIWDAIVGILKGAVNLIVDVINGLLGLIQGAVNGITNGINKITGEVGIPAIPQINIPRIPKLATGAVIPPNAEFMAILGDQKNGNNIEAPEDLIRQIVREETEALANRPIYVRTEISGKTLMNIIAEQESDMNKANGYTTGGGVLAY